MKKILAIALITVLALCSLTSAATYYPRSNSAQRYGLGGQVLVSANAQVWVYTSGSTTLTTIFSSSTGSPLSNPVTADQYGNYLYYTTPGFYDETVVGPAGTSPITINNISIGLGIVATNVPIIDGRPTPTTITVNASPFTYTNNDSAVEDVYLYSGTVSSIVFSRGTTTFTIATATNIDVLLSPGDTIITTYTVTPTMVKVQL